ncbi:MAG: hypothetical protein GXX90_02735 [Microbacteriaceae bacterium]|nr:hypothetical protein [Microbacteriaceae bacterium]
MAAVGALAIAAAALLRPVRFPVPGGPHRVGTALRHWRDPERAELLAPGEGRIRELPAQIWYPTATTSGERARYLPDAPLVLAALLQALRVVTDGRTAPPAVLFRKLTATRARAILEAPPLAGRTFPAVVALSGFGGFPTASTALIEELVSWGLVVVAIDQPYVSARARLADGTAATMLARGSLYEGRSREEVHAHLVADASAALDALGDDPLLAPVVDTRRSGVMGVSLGGTIPAVAARADSRFAACLMLDATMPPGVAAEGIPAAALWLTRPADDMRRERRRAGGWPEEVIAETHGSMVSALAAQAPGTGRIVRVRGMHHIDFTDAPRWFPWARWVGWSGRIGHRRAHRIVAALASRFLVRELGGRGAARPGCDPPRPGVGGAP